jgi:hypothetical protein
LSFWSDVCPYTDRGRQHDVQHEAEEGFAEPAMSDCCGRYGAVRAESSSSSLLCVFGMIAAHKSTEADPVMFYMKLQGLGFRVLYEITGFKGLYEITGCFAVPPISDRL